MFMLRLDKKLELITIIFLYVLQEFFILNNVSVLTVSVTDGFMHVLRLLAPKHRDKTKPSKLSRFNPFPVKYTIHSMLSTVYSNTLGLL